MLIASATKRGRVESSLSSRFILNPLSMLFATENEALHKTIKPSVLDEMLALLQMNDFSLQRSHIDNAHSTKTESTILMVRTEGKWRGDTLLLSHPTEFLIKI